MQLKIAVGHLAAGDGGAHAPQLVTGDVIGCVDLRAARHQDAWEVAAGDRHEVRRHRLVVPRDEDGAVVRVAESVDFDEVRQ